MTGNRLRQDADAACLLAGLAHMGPRRPFPKEWPFHMSGNRTAVFGRPAAPRLRHVPIGMPAGPDARRESSHGG